MRREIDKMMRLRRISIIFVILLSIFGATVAGMMVFMNTGDYNGINPQFGKYEAIGEAETKSYQMEKESFDTVLFFSMRYMNQRTLFRRYVPSLKIVNSDEYRIEVKANKDLIEKLKFTVVEGCLCVHFDEELYEDVNRNNRAYKGLFIDCDTFEMTVYAPITSLATDAEIALDFDAAEADTLIVEAGGAIVDGVVHNIDSRALSVLVDDSSNIKLVGKATETSVLVANHNSKIDAKNLQTESMQVATSARLFGFPQIKHAGGSYMRLADPGIVITAFFMFAIVTCAFFFLFFRARFLKQKEKVDKYIEEEKKLEKYLKV